MEKNNTKTGADFSDGEKFVFSAIIYGLTGVAICVWIIIIGWVWRHIVVPLFSYWS